MQIEIIQGTRQKIYQFGAVQYDIHFPLHWALEPKQLENGYVCGPSECNNCMEYGSYHGVFIGYCLNCATAYGYERGNGFLDHGVECLEGAGREAKNSVWNTYLKDVKLEDIGWHSWTDPMESHQWDEEEEEDPDTEHEVKVEENVEEKEGIVFHEVESEVSDDDSEYDDDYHHDYVDSESEHFCVRRW